MASDEQLESAVSRLTDNEKECLRRCLLPQSAKEMAIDLGISVHAVEKRLKMARTRLGLTSSLAAARQLAKAERYGELGPYFPDLAGRDPIRDETKAADSQAPTFAAYLRRHNVVIVLGVPIMSFLFAALAVLLSQASANSAAHSLGVQVPIDRMKSPGPSAPGSSRAQPVMRPASPSEVREFLASSFSAMDHDNSGFIERNEAPTRFGVSQTYPAGERPRNLSVTWLTGTVAQAAWISTADTDADGRVSRSEYIDWGFPVFSRSGLPVNWSRRP